MNTYALMAHGVRMLLPLSERIAVRTMMTSAISGALLVVALILNAAGSFDDVNDRTLVALFGIAGIAFVASFFTFVVLFSSFARVSGSRRD